MIVTTATARDSWERHIKDLLPSVPADSIRCLMSSNDYIGEWKVLITSYPLMDKNVDRLAEKYFGFVIMVSDFDFFFYEVDDALVLIHSLIQNKIFPIYRMNRIQSKISKQKHASVPHAYAKKQSESFCFQVTQ